jgi:hypothetical protein
MEAGVQVMFGKKKERVLVQERLKPDEWRLWPGKLWRPTDKSDNRLALDGRQFIVPDEKEGQYVRFHVKHKIDKGIHRMFLLETAQIVAPPDNLATAPSPVLDNQTVSGVVNRTSARRLAAPKLPQGQLYIWLLMGAIVGISIGWILYPQFNHPAPIIEICQRLANGSSIPRGMC